jgi:hypothetical protein
MVWAVKKAYLVLMLFHSVISQAYLKKKKKKGKT